MPTEIDSLRIFSGQRTRRRFSPDVLDGGQEDFDLVGQEDGAVGLDLGQIHREDGVEVAH